jgi:ATP phosphoribosyltransferase
MQLFEDADLAVNRASDVAYRASIADPRISEVRILRPQEIPVYVADGLFDIGITGRDCIEERGSEVVSLGELSYSKATSNPAQVVLAVAGDSPVRTLEDLAALPGRLRISSEYPELTRKALAAHGIEADIALSYGATEAKVPDIADAVVDMTETGSALRAAGLRVIATLLVSHTEFIANPVAAADPNKRHAMEQILTLLQGTLEARGKVLVKLNVSADALHAVLEVLPSMRAPTISELSGGGAFALETVVAKSDINTLIPALRDHGASDILELPLSKIVH